MEKFFSTVSKRYLKYAISCFKHDPAKALKIILLHCRKNSVVSHLSVMIKYVIKFC